MNNLLNSTFEIIVTTAEIISQLINQLMNWKLMCNWLIIKFIFSGRRRLKDSQITACLTRGEDLLLFSVYIIINWLSLSFWLLTRQNKTSEENPNHDLPDKRSTVILKGFSALLQEKRRVEKSWGPGHFPWCVCIMEETELSPIINVHRKEIRSHT